MKIVLSKNDLDSIILIILEVGLIFSIIGIAFAFPLINSMGVWLIFFSAIIYFILELYSEIKLTLEVVALLIIIIIAFISMSLSKQINYEGLSHLLSFLEIPFFIVFLRPNANVKRINIVAITEFIIVVLYLVAFYSDRSHVIPTIYGTRLIDDLTLGFSNPNETAMHLFAAMTVSVSLLYYYKNKLARCLLFLILILLLFFINETHSRAGIIFSVLFLVSVIPFIRIEKLIPVFQYVSLLFPVLVLLLSITYSAFFKTHSLFGQQIDTGRIDIYLQRLTNLKAYQWILGDYSYLFQNSLNSYLSVLVTLGLPSLLLFFYLIYRCSIFIKSSVLTDYGLIAYLAFLITIMYSSVESASLVSGSLYAISIVNFIILSYDYDIKQPLKTMGEVKNGS